MYANTHNLHERMSVLKNCENTHCDAVPRSLDEMSASPDLYTFIDAYEDQL